MFYGKGSVSVPVAVLAPILIPIPILFQQTPVRHHRSPECHPEWWSGSGSNCRSGKMVFLHLSMLKTFVPLAEPV